MKTLVIKIFSVTPLIRSGLLLVLLAAPSMSWAFRHVDDASWLHAIDAIGVFCIFLAWPRPIHFDAERIWQRDRLGRLKSIDWSQVDSLVRVPGGSRGRYDMGSTIVAGGDTQIVFNPMYGGDAPFCDLIEQRTGRKFLASSEEIARVIEEVERKQQELG